jgi:uncharacterized protein YbjT (DUF2867 family)
MIALLGATGTIGRHVAAGLAERHADARAVVRDPSRSDVPLPLVHGDLSQPQTLRAAFEGTERLLLLTPHDPEQDLQEAAAVEAAVAAGVQQIVKISGGAPSLGPNGPSPTAVGHWRTEQLIEASGLRWTFLRPSFLMQNLLSLPLTGGVLLAPMGHAPIAMIDARDVAACAVAALTADDGDGAWHLTGPAGVTFAEVAPHLGARRYVNVPRKVAAAAMRKRGATPFEVEHAMGWRATWPPAPTALRRTTSSA